MASSCTRRNSALVREDELTGSIPTKSSNTLTPSPAISQVQTPTPAQAPVPAPPDMYIYINLQIATSLAIKSFVKGQEHGKINSAS